MPPIPTWPAELPQRPQLGAETKRIPDVVTPDFNEIPNAPSQARRRGTRGRDLQACELILSGAQLRVFQDFYSRVLVDGILPFNWIDFATDKPATLRFVDLGSFDLVAPGADPDTRTYTVDLTLEKV